MIGTIVDYGKGWAKVLSGERLFYMPAETENVRMGQDFEFDPEKSEVAEVAEVKRMESARTNRLSRIPSA